MTSFPKIAILLLFTLVAVTWRLHCFLKRRNLARAHGCQPVARSYTRDPFLGLDRLPSTLRAVRRHRILEHGCSLFSTYGSTFSLQELQRTIILTNEPENIKTVLSVRFHDYGIHYRLEPFRPLLGEGIFSSDGAHWSASRALIRPSFTRDQVADLTELENLVGDLLALLPRDGVTVVDLQELFFRYTIDSATSFLFGRSVGSLRNTIQGEEIAFAEAFHYAQEAVLTRAMTGPLNLICRDRKAEECNRICRSFAQRFVDDAVQAVHQFKQGSTEDTVSDTRQPDSDTRHPKKHVFSHELASRTSDKQRILDELMNVLLAGRDTTACLLSNLFFVLARSPVVWQKLRAEVGILGGRPPTYDELRALKYVRCCVNESLRLHPPVPRNERMAIRDTVLPLGGGKDGLSPAFVPKGTVVSWKVYAMHRRTSIYGEDAEEFRPERWEDGKLRPQWGFLPFSGGPRVCIGQQYALTEASYVLVRMVQKMAAIQTADPRPWEESLTLTLCSRNGVKVRLFPA